MTHVRRIGFAFFLIALLSANAFGQTKPSPTPVAASLLSVGGEVERPLKLTAADWAKLPRRTVSAKDHGGKETSFEGVEVGEVLKLAGVRFGEALHGKNLALFLVVDARDGYRVVFALPELDHAYTDRVILLADRRDGKALAEAEGPLHLVIPEEKHQGRWVRQVITLTIRRAE